MSHVDSFNEQTVRSSAVLAGARVGASNNSQEELRKAALFVASNAADADDCRLLLEALGILGHGVKHRVTAHRRVRVEEAS
jgi:hypothetical protein